MSRASSAAKPELAADAPVQIFGQRLGHLDREPVQIKVVLIAVLRRTIRAPASEARRPIVTTCSPITSRSPASPTSRKKSAMHSPPALFWRGNVNRVELAASVQLEQDEVVALGGAGQ